MGTLPVTKTLKIYIHSCIQITRLKNNIHMKRCIRYMWYIIYRFSLNFHSKRRRIFEFPVLGEVVKCSLEVNLIRLAVSPVWIRARTRMLITRSNRISDTNTYKYNIIYCRCLSTELQWRHGLHSKLTTLDLRHLWKQSRSVTSNVVKTDLIWLPCRIVAALWIWESHDHRIRIRWLLERRFEGLCWGFLMWGTTSTCWGTKVFEIRLLRKH